MILNNDENPKNNGTEEIGLVSTTPDPVGWIMQYIPWNILAVLFSLANLIYLAQFFRVFFH